MNSRFHLITLLAGFVTLSTACETDAGDAAKLREKPAELKTAINTEVANSSFSGSWPQWLGPDRNGIVSGTIRSDWEKRAPREVWRVEIGEGFSGISVVNGKAYTMFTDGNNEYVAAYDAMTGKEIWRKRTGDHFSDWQGGDGPRSTPTIDGNNLYTISAGGSIYALNIQTGEQVWVVDMKKTFGARVPQWGFSGSPLVDGDRLYVETGGSPGKALVALNKNTGAAIWTSQSDIIGYSSPILINVKGVEQLVFFTGANLMAVSPDNGELFWKTPWKTSYDVNAATPLFIEPNTMFISSEYDVGCAAYEITGSKGNFQARQLWKNREMKNQMATSIYHNGYLYGIDSKVLKCIDLAKGEEQWVARGYGKGSLIMVGENLLVLSERGTLGLVEATPDAFNELAKVQVLNGRCWTIPTYVDGFVFMRNLNEMVCLDLR